MNHYLIALPIIVWLLGVPGHYSDWDHYKSARFLALFWPIVVVFAFFLTLLLWAWDQRPRWRWRVRWVREVSIKHYGWTTKKGKLCGAIRIVKIFGLSKSDHWVASGVLKGDWMLGTVTRPEL